MAPKTPPGQTRQRVLRFVRERLLEGNPPTVREVQEAFGFRSVQTAREHLETLVSSGKLIKEAGKSRSYRLPEDEAPTNMAFIPLLGAVQAGALSEAVEDPQGYIPVQTDASGQDLFGLRVRGDSMIDAGILPDDVVIVRRQPTAQNGDIVVALVEEEATVKRLRIEGRRVILQPENPHFEPIVPDPEKLVLLGKVVEVRRYLEKN